MISVCMTTYNGQQFIKEQLTSILSQLNESDELLISDDGSTDNTLAIIQRLEDDRIKVYHHEASKLSPRKKVIKNIEFILKKAQADVIFLADQDDIWMPNKVERTMEALDKYDLIISDAIIINKNGNVVHPSYIDLNHSKEGFLNGLLTNPYLGCAMAFKRNVLIKALPFPKNIPMHDIWLGSVGSVFFKTKLLKEPLIKYRRHINNISTSGEKSTNSLVQKIDFRLQVVFGIIGCYFKNTRRI